MWSKFAIAQTSQEFGSVTLNDDLKIYDKDSTANAIYTYERGENKFAVRNNKIRLIKNYHAKIKILKKEGIDVSQY